MLASVRPTLDPLTLTPLRNAVMHSAWGRGKIDLPPGIAKKLETRRVFVGTEPKGSWFKKDLAKSMRVERVSDKGRNEKFKVRDERQAQQADNGRKPEVNPGRKWKWRQPGSDAGRGNKPDRVSRIRCVSLSSRKGKPLELSRGRFAPSSQFSGRRRPGSNSNRRENESVIRPGSNRRENESVIRPGSSRRENE